MVEMNCITKTTRVTTVAFQKNVLRDAATTVSVNVIFDPYVTRTKAKIETHNAELNEENAQIVEDLNHVNILR
jgi:hypothetical protein